MATNMETLSAEEYTQVVGYAPGATASVLREMMHLLELTASRAEVRLMAAKMHFVEQGKTPGHVIPSHDIGIAYDRIRAAQEAISDARTALARIGFAEKHHNTNDDHTSHLRKFLGTEVP